MVCVTDFGLVTFGQSALDSCILAFMSFEDHFLRHIDKKKEEERRIRKQTSYERETVPNIVRLAHNRAKRDIFSNREYSIQAPDFTSVYTEEGVRKDFLKVLRLKKKWESEESDYVRHTKIMAETLEAIILTQCDSSHGNWLNNARVLKTSMYDDFINKTDMCAEWYNMEEGSRILALGVDVTFGKRSLEQKLRVIRDEIDRDELGSIRYFKDARGDFMGTRNNVPRTVVAVSPDMVEELSVLWMKNDERALSGHAVQHLITEQIRHQLKVMCTYAKTRGKETAAHAYASAFTTFVRNQTPEHKNIPFHISKTRVATELAYQVDALFGSK